MNPGDRMDYCPAFRVGRRGRLLWAVVQRPGDDDYPLVVCGARQIGFSTETEDIKAEPWLVRHGQAQVLAEDGPIGPDPLAVGLELYRQASVELN
jgi:hypothetical protein